jgi:hypothetical protein
LGSVEDWWVKGVEDVRGGVSSVGIGEGDENDVFFEGLFVAGGEEG